MRIYKNITTHNNHWRSPSQVRTEIDRRDNFPQTTNNAWNAWETWNILKHPEALNNKKHGGWETRQPNSDRETPPKGRIPTIRALSFSTPDVAAGSYTNMQQMAMRFKKDPQRLVEFGKTGGVGWIGSWYWINLSAYLVFCLPKRDICSVWW